VRSEGWTIPEVIACRLRADAGVEALVSDESRITYAGLDGASRALAARLVRDLNFKYLYQ